MELKFRKKGKVETAWLPEVPGALRGLIPPCPRTGKPFYDGVDLTAYAVVDLFFKGRGSRADKFFKEARAKFPSNVILLCRHSWRNGEGAYLDIPEGLSLSRIRFYQTEGHREWLEELAEKQALQAEVTRWEQLVPTWEEMAKEIVPFKVTARFSKPNMEIALDLADEVDGLTIKWPTIWAKTWEEAKADLTRLREARAKLLDQILSLHREETNPDWPHTGPCGVDLWWDRDGFLLGKFTCMELGVKVSHGDWEIKVF